MQYYSISTKAARGIKHFHIIQLYGISGAPLWSIDSYNHNIMASPPHCAGYWTFSYNSIVRHLRCSGAVSPNSYNAILRHLHHTVRCYTFLIITILWHLCHTVRGIEHFLITQLYGISGAPARCHPTLIMQYYRSSFLQHSHCMRLNIFISDPYKSVYVLGCNLALLVHLFVDLHSLNFWFSVKNFPFPPPWASTHSLSASIAAADSSEVWPIAAALASIVE